MAAVPAPPTLLINGRPADALSAGERGFHYGDGLFETIALRDGELCLWPQHWARLLAGAERLGLPPPPETLAGEARDLARGCVRGVLKLIYSAGAGGRGYGRPEGLVPTRVLQLHAAPDWPLDHWQRGVAVRYCELRLAAQPRLAGIKHLNRLEQVLARAEWQDASVAEGLLLDQNGQVVEATFCNLFSVRDGRLRTPPMDTCGVRGVMRDYLWTLAEAEGLAVEESPLCPEDLAGADEVFLCNSLIGLWPVARLADRPLVPGPVATRLLRRLVEAEVCLAPHGAVSHA